MVDDNADPPADSVDLYYHTSVEERERTFPIDPDITRSQTTSDVYTEWRDKFCDDVAVRDSERCVLTGALSRACKAAHLIAHSKGDEVFALLTSNLSSLTAVLYNRRSTFRLLPGIAVETPLDATLYNRSTTSETEFF